MIFAQPSLSTRALVVHRLAVRGWLEPPIVGTLALVPDASGLGWQPFRGSVAIASGRLTKDQLRAKAWRRLFTDVYVDARAPVTQRLLIQAAALRLPPGGLVTGRSAAYLWGAELGDLGDPVEIIAPSRMSAQPGIAVRTGRVDASEARKRYRVAVPTPLHTAWELARTLPVLEAVPWIDALARARRLDTSMLRQHGQLHAGEFRCVAAARALSLSDRRAESPPESTVRVGLILGGVPAPTPQFEVFVAGFFARVDLAWEEIKLALEYDGQWHADRDQLSRDRIRIRNLNAAGWYVYPVTRNDLRDLDRVVRAVAALVDRRSRLL